MNKEELVESHPSTFSSLIISRELPLLSQLIANIGSFILITNMQVTGIPQIDSDWNFNDMIT